MSNTILLAGRALLAAAFIVAGFAKIADVGGTAGYFASLGLPGGAALVWLVILVEIIGGLAILFGYQTALAAYVLAAFAIGSGFVGHFGQGGDDPMMVMINQQAFMKNLAIAGGFLVLAIAGPGALSVDARLGRSHALTA
jgi:putative oxidoreductase